MQERLGNVVVKVGLGVLLAGLSTDRAALLTLGLGNNGPARPG